MIRLKEQRFVCVCVYCVMGTLLALEGSNSAVVIVLALFNSQTYERQARVSSMCGARTCGCVCLCVWVFWRVACLACVSMWVGHKR
jgi:hypothetical protein